jgi:hypothetical protein
MGIHRSEMTTDYWEGHISPGKNGQVGLSLLYVPRAARLQLSK